MTAPEPTFEAIDAAAATWIAHIRAGPMDEAARREMIDWLAMDKRHADAFAFYESLWVALDDVRDEPRMLKLREHRTRRVHWAVPALAALLLAGFSLPVILTLGQTVPAEPQSAAPPATYLDTELGQIASVALEDGSTVTLDTDSAIESRFDARIRQIRVVRGRAFFHVAHERRPFTVNGRRLAVVATGTQFVVDLRTESDRVAMVEGSVIATRINSNLDARLALRAGRSLEAGSDGQWQLGRIDPETAMGWVSGRLVFRDQRLDGIAVEMNRYSRRKIRFADAKVASARLSAVLKAGDNATLASGASDLALARVVRRDEKTIVLASPR